LCAELSTGVDAPGRLDPSETGGTGLT